VPSDPWTISDVGNVLNDARCRKAFVVGMSSESLLLCDEERICGAAQHISLLAFKLSLVAFFSLVIVNYCLCVPKWLRVLIHPSECRLRCAHATSRNRKWQQKVTIAKTKTLKQKRSSVHFHNIQKPILAGHTEG
jgi:hypothetical protein